MILHIGAEESVFLSDVVGIVNVQTAEKRLLKRLCERLPVIDLDPANHASLVIVRTPRGEKGYFSPIAAMTLLKRANEIMPGKDGNDHDAASESL